MIRFILAKIRFSHLALLVPLLFLFFIGCSDNPVDSNDQPLCDHIDADGMIIEHDDDHNHDKDLEVIAHQWEGNVTGEIELEEGETLSEILISFLDADSTRIEVPEDCLDHSLGWTIADTNVVQATMHEDSRWEIDLEPREHGETTIQFKIIHGDHSDFTSLHFDIHVHEHGEEHAEAEGMILRRDGIDLVRVWQGTVAGQLEVAAGGETLPIDVIFLDEDEDEFTPHGEEHSLDVHVDDDALVSRTMTGAWQFTLAGIAEGQTNLDFTILHDGHDDFSAADIPVVILPAAATPEALTITHGGTHLVSWNYHGGEGSTSEGVLLLEVGENRSGLSLNLLGEWVQEQGHAGGHRDILMVPNGRYHVEWQVADTAVATLVSPAGSPWQIQPQGLTAGSTTVVARLVEGSTTVFETAPMPIVVVAADAGDPNADYFLKKNGVRIVYVVDGDIAQPTECSEAAGQLDVDVDDETDLYLLKWLEEGCGQGNLDNDLYLSFRMADPSIAAITGHPIHWDERTMFHLRGLAAGQTTLKFYLLDGDTQEVLLVSPELPVIVSMP